MKTDPEPFIKKYGEKYRKLIIDALLWLDEEEPKWKLKHPMGRKGFIRELLSKVAK